MWPGGCPDIRNYRFNSKKAGKGRYALPGYNDPDGGRTRVAGLKGPCPNRWTTGSLFFIA